MTISNGPEPDQIQPDPDLGRNLFWYYRTICLMKLLASIMLTDLIKRQYSSVLLLLRHCLPVFDKVCGMAMDFVFLLSE